MGVGEFYLKIHYSHYLTRLATEGLTRMRNDIGLDGRFLREGDDFAVMDDEVTVTSSSTFLAKNLGDYFLCETTLARFWCVVGLGLYQFLV